MIRIRQLTTFYQKNYISEESYLTALLDQRFIYRVRQITVTVTVATRRLQLKIDHKEDEITLQT